MKKIILLILIGILTFSCHSSDDNEIEQNSIDPIIAKWQFGRVIYFYDNGTQITIDPNQCDLQSNYSFFVDNRIQIISFIQNGNDGCVEEIPNFEYFNWSKIEEGKYRITSKNPNESEEVHIENATFEDNIMIWTDSFDNPQSNVVKTVNYFNKQN